MSTRVVFKYNGRPLFAYIFLCCNIYNCLPSMPGTKGGTIPFLLGQQLPVSKRAWVMIRMPFPNRFVCLISENVNGSMLNNTWESKEFRITLSFRLRSFKSIIPATLKTSLSYIIEKNSGHKLWWMVFYSLKLSMFTLKQVSLDKMQLSLK